MNTKKLISLLILTACVSSLVTYLITKNLTENDNSTYEKTIVKEIIIEDTTVPDIKNEEINNNILPNELSQNGWSIAGEYDELYVKDIDEHVIADNDFVKITANGQLEYDERYNYLIVNFIMENKTNYKIDMYDDGLEMNGCMLELSTYANANKLTKTKGKMYIHTDSIIDFDLTKLGEITGTMYLQDSETFKRISSFEISIKL